MVQTIYLPPSIKAANEAGHKLKSQIEELTQKASSIQSADKVIAHEESTTRARLEGLKKLVEQGLVMKRDEKATANEIIRLTEELQGIQKKRVENGKQLTPIQEEIKKLQAELDQYFAVQILDEPKPKAPVIHNAMAQSLSTFGNKLEKKELEEQHPSFLISRP